ncbi:MAG: hypothetical protein ACT4TC_20260 [Myxococcaceae bacterium]
MRLGDLLLTEQLVSPEALNEALEAQVVHGGRLGTNLLELGLITEKDLSRSLGRAYHTAFASGEMKPDPHALILLTKDFCDERDVVPMRVEPTRLTLAVINPGDLATFDEVAFKTGRVVTPVLIPEFRMNQMLRRYCGAFRQVRAIDMSAAKPKNADAQKLAPVESADLMSEEEFQSVYAKALSGGALDDADDDVIVGVEIVEPPHIELLPEEVVPPRAPPPAPPPAKPVSRQVEEKPILPLTFPQAQQQLSASEDREEIARTVLSFASTKWKRALVLSVQGSLVTGWHGVGVGVQMSGVRRIAVALRGQATLKLVRDTRSHYIGPVKRDAGMDGFYKLLGGDYPKTAVLLPLLVRRKVVHILYVDNGPSKLTPPDIGELLILGQSVARSYEVLLRRHTAH